MINNGQLALKVRPDLRVGSLKPVLSSLFDISILDLFGVKMDQTSLNTLTTIESDVNSLQIEPMKISTYLFKS